jgi:hypothetical protein
MLEELVEELEKKLDKEIKHNQALAKRVVEFMRKERVEEETLKKKEVSCSKKKEATKDMMARWSDGGQWYSKDLLTWRK